MHERAGASQGGARGGTATSIRLTHTRLPRYARGMWHLECVRG